MSTVVYRNGILAADSLMVQGSIKCPEGMNKISLGRTHPVIYAMAGRAAALATTVRIIEAMPVAPWDGADYPTRPPIDGNSELAIFHRDGRIISIEAEGMWFEPADAPFMALGSGSKAALGALHMGATAEQAVAIASLVDTFTGGAVVMLRVADIWQDRHPQALRERMAA